MQDLSRKERRRFFLFFAIACLVLAQVAWWASLFVGEVGSVQKSRRANLELAIKHGEIAPSEGAAREAVIDSEAFHRRRMFLSESAFFAFISCLGLFLIFRAVRDEAHSREIQRNFIEIVTHESKTPLTALKLRLESVESKRKGDAALSRELALAQEEVRRLISIFEKAMSLNRMERAAFHFEEVSVPLLVKDLLRRLEPFLKEKNVSVELDLAPEVTVRADAHGLQTCIQSLLENAVLYNDRAEKRVRIAVREEYSVAVISVADNGPGIAASDRPHIFERFYRAKSGRRVPGTGLGLYLAKSILEAHNGTIKLVEAAEGSRFEIELPAVKA